MSMCERHFSSRSRHLSLSYCLLKKSLELLPEFLFKNFFYKFCHIIYYNQKRAGEMIVKKAISFLSELGETTFFNGMNTCKSAISRVNKLILSVSDKGRFEGLLKSTLKSHDVLKKERIIKLKEKFLLKIRHMDSSIICCPNCGSALPYFYTFCACCGTQLFDDILDPESSKSVKFFPESINQLLDISILLNNLKLPLFLYKKFDKCLLSLTGLDNRV